MRKLLPLWMGCVLASGLFAGAASADDSTRPALRQPLLAEYSAANHYYDYFAQDTAAPGEAAATPPAPTVAKPQAAVEAPAADSPSDLPAPATEQPASSPVFTESPSYRAYGDPCNDKPWTLPQPCFLKEHGIAMGGWIEQGVTFNSRSPGDGSNGPVATNDWDREYQMNQLWLYFARPTNNGGSGWDIGGRVDMIFGTDWRFGINDGLETNIDGFNYQSYGLVLPQMYMEVAYNNLTVKLGHFAGILDYEAVPCVANPFYSHSYSYGYTVPQLVTGAIGDYKLNEQWSIQAGFHRGWLMFEDNNNDLDFMGGVKWNSGDKRTSLSYAVSTGPQDPAGEQERFVGSFVVQHQFTDKFRYVMVQNTGFEDDAIPDDQDGEFYGINQYLLYNVNEKWAANMRFEWLRDDDGTRVAGPGNIPGVRAWRGAGFAGNFFELTCGTTWHLSKNAMLRPEARWDWYDGPDGVKGPAPFVGGQRPFNQGLSSSQFTLGTDLIITY